MRMEVGVLGLAAAILASLVLGPSASHASGSGGSGGPPEREGQAGEHRWVPSLTITSGATVQEHKGVGSSFMFQGGSPTAVPLQGTQTGDDLAVSPFVGASLELMTPALPIPTRPRLFLAADLLPTFAVRRSVAVQGDINCLSGPEADAVCAKDEIPGVRRRDFGEDSVNGEGTLTTALVDTLTFGMNLGVAFPVEFAERQLRIKPSFGWISYEVAATGLVADAACDPVIRCTDVTFLIGFPAAPGFLRETILSASASKRFHGIGPGLDIEMDTGQYGPIGASLFLGARAYYVVGDRNIKFGTTHAVADQIGTDVVGAQFRVAVAPWVVRAHVGIRFQWLGSQN